MRSLVRFGSRWGRPSTSVMATPLHNIHRGGMIIATVKPLTGKHITHRVVSINNFEQCWPSLLSSRQLMTQSPRYHHRHNSNSNGSGSESMMWSLALGGTLATAVLMTCISHSLP
jgi:hypothetical protein